MINNKNVHHKQDLIELANQINKGDTIYYDAQKKTGTTKTNPPGKDDSLFWNCEEAELN